MSFLCLRSLWATKTNSHSYFYIAIILCFFTTIADDINDMTLWANAWRVWLAIGTSSTIPPELGK